MVSPAAIVPIGSEENAPRESGSPGGSAWAVALAPVCPGIDDSVVRVEFSDPRGRLLSNLAPTSFVIDGVRVASVEAFIQGIKFPPHFPERERVLSLSGVEAKRAGAAVSAEIRQGLEKLQDRFVFWQGQQIRFGSEEHAELIGRAIALKFQQNADAREALRATGDAILVHPIPDAPFTSLPGARFIAMLIAERLKLSPQSSAP